MRVRQDQSHAPRTAPFVSEEHYRKLIETARDVCYTVAPDATVASVNPAFQQLTGWRPEEWLGRPYLELLHPDDVPLARDRFARLMAGESLPPTELRFRTAFGSYVIGEVSVTTLRKAGRISGILGIARDVTERVQAEAALRESEERYRLLVNQATDIIYRTDAAGRFTFANPTTMRLMGYTEPEVLGHRFTEFIRPDYVARAKWFYGRQFIRKQPTTYFEFPAIAKDGREIWFGQNVHLLQEDGRVVGFSAVARDITERERAEHALQESEERFRQLAQNIKEVFWLLEVTTNRVIYVSPAYQELWGRSPESLYADPWSWIAVIHPDDRAHVMDAFNTKLVAGTYDEEYRLLLPDGSLRWIRDQAFPISGEQGTVYRVAGIASDITERKLAERALAANEKRLKTILEAEPECVMLMTKDAVLLDINPAGLALVEAEPVEDLAGRSVLPLIAPAHREAFAGFTRRVHAGQSGVFRFEVIGLKGARRWVETHAVPLRNEQQDTVEVLAVTRDITARKKAEEALQRALQAQEQLARDLHDNIIQSVYAVGFTLEECQELLKGGPPNASLKLSQVIGELNRIIREVRGYLATTREKTDLLTADEFIASLQRLRGLMERADGVHFSLDIDRTAADALTDGQRVQFMSVAQEAMSNCLRHSCASTVRVSLARAPRAVRLDIRDNGIGFELPKMRNGNGGLKNIRLRARRIGANLDISSHPMGGTLLSLELPLES